MAFQDVRFPAAPSFPFTTYMPQVWRMDYGPGYAATRVITTEPPKLGAPYRVLVPQVNADGNDVSGVRLPELAVPLGTYTGWNVTIPQLADLRYLAGLVGGFEPFPLTRALREQSGDARLSVEERCERSDYLGTGAAGGRRSRQAAVHAQRGRAGGDAESRGNLGRGCESGSP